MMNEEYFTPRVSYDPNHCCGRPFPKAQPCGCSCYQPCQHKMPACIKRKEPDCLAKAVIPAVTVDSIDGILTLANCFVHVTSINTTFYIDDKHRPMITWAGPVEVENYDITANPLNLRSQTCYTTINEVYTEVYFDKQGASHIMGTEQAEG